MPKIAISSGHGLHVRGASGFIDEVDEARRVVDKIAELLGSSAVKFHDDTSTSQDQNLKTIVAWHDSQERDLDVSVHFNAYTQTQGAMGCEVLYVSQQAIAQNVSRTLAASGQFIDRGDKYRSDLYFLNKTDMPSILIETCFVDAQTDVNYYNKNFDNICNSLAHLVLGKNAMKKQKDPVLEASGLVSWFGGPEDMGVSPSEGLAFITSTRDKPSIFLKAQPPNTSGLARRLDSEGSHYIAMRWDYEVYPKSMLKGKVFAKVRAPKTGREFTKVAPADWGPHVDTQRVADISKRLMDDLGITTDDEVEVTFPV